MHSEKSKEQKTCFCTEHLLINGLGTDALDRLIHYPGSGMDALANGRVGSMDMARCRPERQLKRGKLWRCTQDLRFTTGNPGIQRLLKTEAQRRGGFWGLGLGILGLVCRVLGFAV